MEKPDLFRLIIATGRTTATRSQVTKKNT